jgi:hypothetical protein
MNYKLLVLGFGAICFGAYIIYDDYKNWALMKNNRAKVYKSIFFGIGLIAVGVFAIYKGVLGQSIH